MANVIVGTLADGQLPNAKDTLYTVPVGYMAHVHIIIANTSSSTPYSFNLYVKRSGGTSRRIAGASTDLPAKGQAEMPSHAIGIKLAAGDAIEGDASTAAVVDYLIHGGKEAVI